MEAQRAHSAIRVIRRTKVVEAGFKIAFFAGEFVVVRVVVDELRLPPQR